MLDRVLRVMSAADAADREDEERMLRTLRRDAVDVLATEGYFTPTLTVEADADGEARYVARVELGPRTRVTEVTIEFTGELASRPEAVEKLRAAWELPVGEPFRDERWSTAKTRLLNRIRSREFAAARIDNSVALVDAQQATARLRVEIDSGPAFTIGAVEVRGLVRQEQALVERFSTLAPGEPYDADKLLEFQRQLQRSPFFGTVIVDVDPANAVGTELPVLVEVREARTKRVAFSLGFSSDVGVRGQAAYRQVGLFGHPYSLQSGIDLDSSRQAGYVDIYLPPQPRNVQDAVGALFELTDSEGVSTARWAAGAQRTFRRESDRASYDHQLALNLQHEERTVEGAPDQDVINDTLSVTYALTRRAVDSITLPTRGNTVSVSATGGIGRSTVSPLSKNGFARLYGRFVQYVPLSPRDQLILRAEAGYVAVDDPRVVPNEFLFRTGGVGTVRGYAFQSLGAIQGEAVTGSTMLFTSSVEYVRWLWDDWGAAVFVDAGDASNDLFDVALAKGYGAGVRYRTLAGPIAVDVAWGDRTHGIRVHFAIAIAF